VVWHRIHCQYHNWTYGFWRVSTAGGCWHTALWTGPGENAPKSWVLRSKIPALCHCSQRIFSPNTGGTTSRSTSQAGVRKLRAFLNRKSAVNSRWSHWATVYPLLLSLVLELFGNTRATASLKGHSDVPGISNKGFDISTNACYIRYTLTG
jgi:hypothetical protein